MAKGAGGGWRRGRGRVRPRVHRRGDLLLPGGGRVLGVRPRGPEGAGLARDRGVRAAEELLRVAATQRWQRSAVPTSSQGAEFVGANLRGARVRRVRPGSGVGDAAGVQAEGLDIDAPVAHRRPGLAVGVNGVDVAPFVEAELNRRFPGRAERRAADPDEPARGVGGAASRPGRPRSSGRRRCRPAPSTCRWAGSGRSHRRCGTWSWPRTCGCAKGIQGVEQPLHPLGLVCVGTGGRRGLARRHDRHAVVRRGARGSGGPRRHGA